MLSEAAENTEFAGSIASAVQQWDNILVGQL
jgi:hypothetical protein